MIVGVDPGKSGALVLLDTPIMVDYLDMPFHDKLVDGQTIFDMLTFWRNIYGVKEACVEQVSSRPQQGVVSTFNFGVSYGIVLGALQAASFEITFVRPQVWKKALNLSSDKDDSRNLALSMWPDNADDFARKKDDGRAEAALIAFWKEEYCVG